MFFKPQTPFQKPLKKLFFGELSGGFSFFIKRSGEIYGLGQNIPIKSKSDSNRNYYDLENEEKTKTPKLLCNQFTGLVHKISSGGIHAMILLKNGSVYGVGDNSDGRLGIGSNVNQTQPCLVTIGKHEKVLDVYAGSCHSIFVTKNGIFATGYNGSGQLGIGRKGDITVPKKMKFDSKIICAGAGFHFTVLFTEDYKCYKTGNISNENGRLYPAIFGKNVLSKTDSIIGFASGVFHLFIITKENKIYGCGSNYGKQFPYLNVENEPDFDEGLFEITGLSRLHAQYGVVSVKTGERHALFLLKNGDVYSSGEPVPGGVKKGLKGSEYGVTKVASNINQIETGKYCSVIVDRFGVCYVAGENEQYDLAINHDDEIDGFEKHPYFVDIGNLDEGKSYENVFRVKLSKKTSKPSVYDDVEIKLDC